jgi:hypothetical protein
LRRKGELLLKKRISFSKENVERRGRLERSLRQLQRYGGGICREHSLPAQLWSRSNELPKSEKIYEHVGFVFFCGFLFFELQSGYNARDADTSCAAGFFQPAESSEEIYLDRWPRTDVPARKR